MPKRLERILAALLLSSASLCPALTQVAATTKPSAASSLHAEYLWLEAENMSGVSVDERNEPHVNPSWMNRPRSAAPGWGMNGPGVSAEWSQGGESEWNSVAASADETRAVLYQEIEIPRDGEYRVWARYADWARRSENFVVRISQQDREVFRREFGAADVIDPSDEVSMYWGWAFAWDGAPAALKKGRARLSVEVERAADARRHVDCLLVTNDLAYRPEGRRKPPFAAQRYLREWAGKRPPLSPLFERETAGAKTPAAWRRAPLAGRDFQMPWNIAEQFWPMYDEPAESRPLFPFNAEPVEAFVEKYKGARDVPLFSSKLVVPVIYINNLHKHLKEGTPFLRYLRETRTPFAVLINYGEARFPDGEGQEAFRLLTGELREQFLGWISGESIGHVWPAVSASTKFSPESSRAQLLEAHRAAYTLALEQKWRGMFQGAQTGAMWDRLIPAQSTSSTTYAHALARWGVRTLGMETAAVQPVTAMRIAFTRGAARQYGANFLYYHAPNFGDTATTFTASQNFAGPAHFFHTRYGATMGPSLSWYRKNYFLYYMAGASAVYLEQGFDQFFKPGPGEHPFQLNPLGRITEEFMRFAERHPDRGTPYTPVAFLLDPAHGFEMTDWPHYPFGVSPPGRHDHAIRELMLAAYYPAAADEGEPATADRQAFTNAAFGDIFDVLVASEEGAEAADSYRAVVVGGRVNWSPAWAAKLAAYVRAGGTVFVNAAQTKGLPAELLGVRPMNAEAEADDADCAAQGEAAAELAGQVFRYERVEPRGAQALIKAPNGDAVVTVNRLGRGRVVFCAVPDLLGLDGRLVPAAAHALAHLFADATPVNVSGDVEHLVNRNERGWVVTLINNRGVYKPQQGLAQVNRDEWADVTLDLRGSDLARASEWTTGSELKIEGDAPRRLVRVRVPAGGVRIVELVPRG
ncbi:MAG TPA: hypothetical protein VD968_17605 [Pyrinomonadaceae bacterium]|nr:hypothetical protein [Pyrinomonadaceae bacterium]